MAIVVIGTEGPEVDLGEGPDLVTNNYPLFIYKYKEQFLQWVVKIWIIFGYPKRIQSDFQEARIDFNVRLFLMLKFTVTFMLSLIPL